MFTRWCHRWAVRSSACLAAGLGLLLSSSVLAAPLYQLNTTLVGPGNGTTSVDVSPDRSTLYATHTYADYDQGIRAYSRAALAVLADYHPLGTIFAFKLSADGQSAWFPDYGGSLNKLNLNTGSLSAPVAIGSWTTGITSNGTRRHLYVHEGSPGGGANGSIVQFDTETGLVVPPAAPLSGEPSLSAGISGAGDYLYMASKNSTPSILHKVRTSDMTVVGTANLPAAITGHVYLSVADDAAKIFVPDAVNNQVHIINALTMMESEPAFTISGGPRGFFVSPDGAHAIVLSDTSAADPVLSVFDLNTRVVTQNWTLSGMVDFNYLNTPYWDLTGGNVYIPLQSGAIGSYGGVAVLSVVPEPVGLALWAMASVVLARAGRRNCSVLEVHLRAV